MYVLDTDASLVAISEIVHQKREWNGRTVLRPSAYGSKMLSDTDVKLGAPKAESPPTTSSQDSPTTPTSNQTSQPQSSTRISFVENPYTFEERHSSLSETLKPAIRQAPLSEPQYDPTYNIQPSLQQDLNRTRPQSQNQNLTPTVDRKLFHPRRNRRFATLWVFLVYKVPLHHLN